MFLPDVPARFGHSGGAAMMISVGSSVSAVRSAHRGSRPAILLAMGQSNMVDRSGADATALWPAKVSIFDPATETLVPPTKNLNWVPSVPGATADYDEGPGHAVRVFATHWCGAHPDRELIVLPAARGGTGFKDEWYADGSGVLFNEMVRLLDSLLEQAPDAEIVAGLMQNGERDAGQKNACYQWNALELIARIRDRYSAEIPFVWGEPGNFASTSGTDFARVRAQIRELPSVAPSVALGRDLAPETYDGLTDIGDGLHFDRNSQEVLGQLDYAALGALSEEVSQPDVALIWQSAGIPDWNNFDIAAYDVRAGDTLLMLTAAHRSSGNAYPDAVWIAGQSATILSRSVTVVTTRLALSASTVTLTVDPLSPLLPVACTWQKQPLGGAISIWRIRNITLADVQTSVGTGALTLTGGAEGMAFMVYAVDTVGELPFSGEGTVLVEGSGNVFATSFSTREVGTAESITLTPDRTPSHGCGVIGVQFTA
ncbi:sialate O-acetylesterase [Donghicola mangrovi]